MPTPPERRTERHPSAPCNDHGPWLLPLHSLCASSSLPGSNAGFPVAYFRIKTSDKPSLCSDEKIGLPLNSPTLPGRRTHFTNSFLNNASARRAKMDAPSQGVEVSKRAAESRRSGHAFVNAGPPTRRMQTANYRKGGQGSQQRRPGCSSTALPPDERGNFCACLEPLAGNEREARAGRGGIRCLRIAAGGY